MATRAGVPTYAEIMEVQSDVRECVRAIEAIVPLAIEALLRHDDRETCLAIGRALKGTPWELVDQGTDEWGGVHDG